MKIFIVSGMVFTVIIIGAIFSGTISSRFGSSQQHTQDLAQSQTTRSIIQKISTPTISNAPALDSTNAPITLIEFGDYQVHIITRFIQIPKI